MVSETRTHPSDGADGDAASTATSPLSAPAGEHADPAVAAPTGTNDPKTVVMIVEIGHAFDSYGFVVLLEDGALEFNGTNAVTTQRMRNIVTNMRGEGQTDAQVLADLPRRLDNYVWAVDRTHETDEERMVRMELERKQAEQRLAHEAEAAKKRAARAGDAGLRGGGGLV